MSKLSEYNDLIGLCRQLSQDAHKGQERWNKQPYFTHPERIATNFVLYSEDKSEDHKLSYEDCRKACVSYLHDVLEDCEGWTAERLIDEGVPTDIVWDVLILTKLKAERYLPYILRIKRSGSDVAISVKIKDIQDNLSDLHLYDTKLGKLIDRYQMALYILTN